MAAGSAVRFEPAASLPAAPTLAAGALHLWLAPLALPDEEVEPLAAVLSAAERQRADRFHFPRHRRRHIVAHAVLRALLGAYTRRPAARLTFSEGPHGKPALEAPGGPHFNMAHSGEYALYGISDVELGVDLEVVRDDRDLLALADRFFAPLERHALAALPAADRSAAFYRAWTRKEAYIKALGTGLSEPLDGFAVSLAPGDAARLLRIEGGGELPQAWRLHHLEPLPDLVGAVALRGARDAVRAWQLTPGACLACAAR